MYSYLAPGSSTAGVDAGYAELVGRAGLQLNLLRQVLLPLQRLY